MTKSFWAGAATKSPALTDPVTTQPVCVIAVPGNTPTFPVTVPPVQVTAAPARIAKLAAAPSAGAEPAAFAVGPTITAIASARARAIAVGTLNGSTRSFTAPLMACSAFSLGISRAAATDGVFERGLVFPDLSPQLPGVTCQLN